MLAINAPAERPRNLYPWKTRNRQIVGIDGSCNGYAYIHVTVANSEQYVPNTRHNSEQYVPDNSEQMKYTENTHIHKTHT